MYSIMNMLTSLLDGDNIYDNRKMCARACVYIVYVSVYLHVAVCMYAQCLVMAKTHPVQWRTLHYI